MREYVWLFLSIGLAVSLVGCGESATGNGSGGSGGGGTMVTVTGTVTAASMGTGPGPVVANATVSVVGGSSTATTDAQGNFSIMAPPGTVLLLSTAQGHWGSLFAQNVPAGGLADLEIEVIPDALVTEIATALETTADTNKGIVAVVFDEDTAVGGENAEISVTNELSFVFNEAEEPEEGSTLIAGGGAEVIFINTDVASPVTATAASAGAQSCPPEFPGVAYSVRAKVLTEIEVVCPVP